jgi:hypothetical protein
VCSVAEQQCACGYSVTNQFYYTLPPCSIVTYCATWSLRKSDLGFGFNKGKTFFPFHLSKPALESTKSPVQCAPGGISAGVRRLGLEADCSPPTSAKFKKKRIYTSTPPVCLRGLHIDSFTFYLCCCNLLQYRQYTYNVKLRRVRTNIVAVEKQSVLHIVSVCL